MVSVGYVYVPLVEVGCSCHQKGTKGKGLLYSKAPTPRERWSSTTPS